MSDPHDPMRRDDDRRDGDHAPPADGLLHPDLEPVEDEVAVTAAEPELDGDDEPDVVERVTAMSEADAPPQEIAREVEQEEPADAADALEALEPEESAEVLTRMEEEAAAEALAYMDPALAATILHDLSPAEAAELIMMMAPDDAADIVQSLPKDLAASFMSLMPGHKAAALSKLALYDPQTAGGLMNTEFLMLPADATVAEAIDLIRAHPEELEYPRLYCVDSARRLVGEVDLRALIVNQPDRRLREFLNPDTDSVPPTLPDVEVANAFERYDHLTLPVVDADGRLLGVVTVDDVIDIIREQQTQEVYKQVGVGAFETVHDPLIRKLKGRAPWLLVNLLTSQIAALVVFLFRDMINTLAALAVLMGMIANQAGNAGQQSLAVTLRGLVLGDIHKGRERVLLGREVALGAVSGVVIGGVLTGLIALLGALGVGDFSWELGVIAGVAMAGSIAMGCLAGTGMPLLMDRLGFDPATGSSIFLTMTTDTVSFLTFLGLSYLLHAWLLAGTPGSLGGAG